MCTTGSISRSPSCVRPEAAPGRCRARYRAAVRARRGAPRSRAPCQAARSRSAREARDNAADGDGILLAGTCPTVTASCQIDQQQQRTAEVAPSATGRTDSPRRSETLCGRRTSVGGRVRSLRPSAARFARGEPTTTSKSLGDATDGLIVNLLATAAAERERLARHSGAGCCGEARPVAAHRSSPSSRR